MLNRQAKPYSILIFFLVLASVVLRVSMLVTLTVIKSEIKTLIGSALVFCVRKSPPETSVLFNCHLTGGFGSYLFGMSQRIAKQSSDAQDANDVKDPALLWMIGFLFVVSFLGLFAVVPLRKVMIPICRYLQL